MNDFGGASGLEQLSESQLKEFGLSHFDMPKMRLESDEYAVKASIPGDDNAYIRATMPSPGVVNVSDIFSGALPSGTGSVFLADALKAHGALPNKQLIISGIINDETIEAYSHKIPASDSLLGRMAGKALNQLGIVAVDYRYEQIRGKLAIVIDTK